jgi:hypothetical protein
MPSPAGLERHRDVEGPQTDGSGPAARPPEVADLCEQSDDGSAQRASSGAVGHVDGELSGG